MAQISADNQTITVSSEPDGSIALIMTQAVKAFNQILSQWVALTSELPIEAIKALADIKAQIVTVSGKLAEITTVAGISAPVEAVAGIKAEIIALNGSITELLALEGELPALTDLHSNLAALLEVNTNTADILAAAVDSQIWADGEDAQVEAISEPGKKSSRRWSELTESAIINFFDPAILALNERGILESAEFLTKLRFLQDRIDFFQSENTLPFTELLWFSDCPSIIRNDGILKFYETSLDAWIKENDLSGSVTATVQPRLVGGIAPNSKPSASNQNGESRFFTHPEISYGAGDAWSATFVISFLANNNDTRSFFLGKGSSIQSLLGIYNTINRIRVASETSGSIDYTPINNVNTRRFTGKNTIVTFVNNGNERIRVFANGIDGGDFAVEGAWKFTHLINAFFSGNINNFCSINLYKIQSSALSAQQVANEYNFLRSEFPEIESTQIGSQEFSTRNFEAVATPEGAVIQNVTDNATWADATNIYDTTVGTEREKLLASAMWCYFDNDVNLGATYGKIFNGYAKNLFYLDMISALYGWNIPLKTALELLEGLDLKMTGTDFWNTGGNNTLGLTVLGAGKRNADGTFTGLKDLTGIWCADASEVLLINGSATMTSVDLREGYSLRLTKND